MRRLLIYLFYRIVLLIAELHSNTCSLQYNIAYLWIFGASNASDRGALSCFACKEPESSTSASVLNGSGVSVESLFSGKTEFSLKLKNSKLTANRK